MCEFCTRHGEGRKWYENIRNFSEEVFFRVNSEEKLKSFLGGLSQSLRVDVARAHAVRQRLPRVYDLIVSPLVTRYLKKVHFGQVVPVEDIESIIDRSGTIVRFPCVCRRVTTKKEQRFCLGIGVDLTAVYSATPDFSDFDRLSGQEAKSLVRDLDMMGKVHSIWTLQTPYIGGICNCDGDCMAYRFQMQMKLGKALWKGEYVGTIDRSLCSGCRECMKVCLFGAVAYDRSAARCSIIPEACFGCGVCRVFCPNSAVSLVARALVPSAASLW